MPRGRVPFSFLSLDLSSQLSSPVRFFFAFSSVSPLHPPLIWGSTVRQGLARFLSLLDFSSATRVGLVEIFPASAPLIAAVFFSPTRARVLHSPRLISAGFLGSVNLLVLLELAPDLRC
jgi:hypothetical protein